MAKNGGKLGKNVPKMGTVPISYKSAGLINQIPIQNKPNAYIRKIKTVQFIYIIEKVGLTQIIG